MHTRVTRRGLLAQAAAAAAGTAVLSAAADAQAQPAPAASRPGGPVPGPALSAYQFGPAIWVRIHERTFCVYRAGSEQKYPYFYPLLGPLTGLPMTDESAMPWPHHRSLFFGCDRVNGGNYWQEGIERGQIRSRGPGFEPGEGDSVVVRDICDWCSGTGEKIIEDQRSFRIAAPDEATRILDCRLRLTARTEIHIDKTNHSLFSVRAARELTPLGGGVLLNSAGKTGEKGTFGEPATWCGFQGTRAGLTESIVLMDHPSNPWTPCKWFTRDYGFASPTPFFWLEDNKPWRLGAGESVNLRYRVLVLGRKLSDPAVNRMYEAFAAS